MTVSSILQYTRFLVELYLKKCQLPHKSQQQGTPRVIHLTATLILIISILAGGYGGSVWLRRIAAEKRRGQRLLRRNSGLRSPSGSRTIFVPYNSSVTKVVVRPTKPTTFDAHRRLFLNPPRAAGLSYPNTPPPQTKPGLNLAFLHQYLSLTSIMIPRWNSKESGLLASQAAFLMLRTYLSLLVARLDGEIVRDLVAGHGRAFLWGIIKWYSFGGTQKLFRGWRSLLTLPLLGFASYNNAILKYFQSKLSIAFRTRLTRYIHDLYLNNNLNYYKLSNLDGGVGRAADQLIAQDLTLFCDSAASLYSSIGKPFVDICFFNVQLYHSLGSLGLAGLLGNYFVTATILKRLSPPFGKLKAIEGRREGDFRSLHYRLITNAEEVAFYGGADMERKFLDDGFFQLSSWMEGIYRLRIRYNMLEDFVLKYSWSAFGYILSSAPVFLPFQGSPVYSSVDNRFGKSRMKEFITNKRLMLSLADAGGRIMYSIKDLTELAAYTSRIYLLISTLHRVQDGAYSSPRGTHPEILSLSDVQGTVHKGYDGLRLEATPIISPSLYPRGGNQLLDALSFKVQSGEHLLISGANGVGKSAIARLVAGLWPVYRGLVSCPRSIGSEGIMFLPQRPYLSIGTLRDQVIYPHSEMDMQDSGRKDCELMSALEAVGLGHLPHREGGWDSRKDWGNVLSGGEKQRMAMARLIYHEPRYAFIDEGTSAVSSDIESLLYERVKAKGITLITTSSRASLKKYHNFNLNLGLGEEGFDSTFNQIGTVEEKSGVERELQELRTLLREVDGWKSRRKEIEIELHKTSMKGGEQGQYSFLARA